MLSNMFGDAPNPGRAPRTLESVLIFNYFA